MKFLISKKYRIFEKTIKYSSILMFVFTVTMSGFLFNNLNKIADASGETLRATNITSTSVSIVFDVGSVVAPSYEIYIVEENSSPDFICSDFSCRQNKTIDSNDLNALGNATINFTGLKPATKYNISLDSGTGSVSYGSFITKGNALVPEIISFPSQIKIGETITITGKNLTGEAGIIFNTTNAVSKTSNQTQITVEVPAGTTDGKITIYFMDGTSITSATSYTVASVTNNPPVVGTTTNSSSSNSGKKLGGLVPDCGVVVGGVMTTPCDFNYLMELINTVITFLLFTLATPLFVLIMVYVGWLYLSAQGSTENVTKAKKILKNAFLGYVIALAAWLIVKTILLGLGFTGETYLK